MCLPSGCQMAVPQRIPSKVSRRSLPLVVSNSQSSRLPSALARQQDLWSHRAKGRGTAGWSDLGDDFQHLALPVEPGDLRQPGWTPACCRPGCRRRRRRVWCRSAATRKGSPGHFQLVQGEGDGPDAFGHLGPLSKSRCPEGDQTGVVDGIAGIVEHLLALPSGVSRLRLP